jgi:hypothetical protein
MIAAEAAAPAILAEGKEEGGKDSTGLRYPKNGQLTHENPASTSFDHVTVDNHWTRVVVVVVVGGITVRSC